MAVPEKTFLGHHTWLARCPVSPPPHAHLHFLPHTLAAVGGQMQRQAWPGCLWVLLVQLFLDNDFSVLHELPRRVFTSHSWCIMGVTRHHLKGKE